MGIKYPAKKKSQFFLYSFLSFFVSCSVFAYLFTQVTLEEINSAITKVPLWFLVMFASYSLAMSICRAWRYKILLQATNDPPDYISLFLVTLVRNLFSDLLPARIGSVVYIYIVNRRLNVPLHSAASSFAICLLFDIIAVLFIGLLLSFTYYSQAGITVLLAGIAVFLLSGIYLIVMSLPLLLFKIKKIIGKMYFGSIKKELLQGWITDLINEINVIKQSRSYGKVFVLSLIIRLLKYISLYSLFVGLIISLGENVTRFPLYKVFAGMMAAEFSASLPISGIAGFGAYEGTWAYVFQLLGYSEKLAAVTSVSHHLITQVYGYSLGALSVLLLLLPLWKVSKRKTTDSGMKEKIENHFWLKFTLLFGAIFIFTVLFAAIMNSFTSVQPQTVIPKGDIRSVYEVQEKPLDIQGKLVFQKTDGIYVQEINRPQGRKIAEGGKYPRWSNDGKWIVFILGKKIMIIQQNGKNRKEITVAEHPQAVGYHPDGKHVLYIDKKNLMMADISKMNVVKIIEGYRFKEFDISDDGRKIVATVKNLGEYTVMLYDLVTKTVHSVAKGCSASLSPDGKQVTVNTSGHRTLEIYDTRSLELIRKIHAPRNDLFDNQKWSNHHDWIVATSEKNEKNIFIQRVSTDRAYKITRGGDCDRADLFVE